MAFAAFVVAVAAVLFIVACALALVTRRPLMLFLVGLIALPLVIFSLVYFSAPTERPADSNCAHCSWNFGRYWDPFGVVVGSPLAVIAWSLGVLTASIVSRVRAVNPRPR